MRILTALAMAAALAALPLSSRADGASGDIPAASSVSASLSQAEQDKQTAQAQTKFIAGLHPQTGTVRLSDDAVLNLGDAYYFVGPEDAKKILVDAWGNPPDQADGVLGMVFPKDGTPFDAWGAVVTYEKTGYVSDKDATTTDYDKYIKDIQAGEAADNAERKKNHYATTHLVGWAQPPSYDKAHHYMIWARDIQFGDQTTDTLNYDVRILGRRGVLSMNMVDSMANLSDIRPEAAQLAAASGFGDGARYDDYKQGDAKAAYGVAGLVAAGLGLAAAKKLGLLAVILAFGKKIFVFLMAGFAAIGRWFSARFGKKKAATVAAPPSSPPADAADPGVQQVADKQDPTVQ